MFSGLVHSTFAVLEVETDMISITARQIGRTAVTAIMYVDNFKRDVFIGNVIMFLTSH